MTEREETEAMSRLLTRGAKMLQKGCDDCGNPLFRYRGEVVCPVCNERRNESEDEDQGQESDPTPEETATPVDKTEKAEERETENTEARPQISVHPRKPT